MTTVAVLGAGAGGLSATVELTRAGHDVVLWNRNPSTVAPYTETGEVPYTGVFGDGSVHPALITTDLDMGVRGVDVVVVCLPSLAHASVFADLATLGVSTPIVLNPGQTAAALHARTVWIEHGATLPPLAQLSTLSYVARVYEDGAVATTGRASIVRAASLPGGEDAVGWAQRLFPCASPVDDVLASGLSNVNLVLHPPGAVLGLAWVEATSGDFTFYVDGMTPGVVRVLLALDDERRALAKAFGHDLPSLVEEMASIGTVTHSTASLDDPGAAIRAGEANRTIMAPDSTRHRYYREDLPFGLLPFVTLAELAGLAVPTAAALLALGGLAVGDSTIKEGLGRRRLGLEGRSFEDLLTIIGH